jgi:hypothetical protein
MYFMGIASERRLLTVNTCEVCLNVMSGPILDLGSHPLCDDLVRIGDPVDLRRYHQEIMLCEVCLTAHQLHQVDKSLLFKRDYHYRAALTQDVIVGMGDLVAKTLRIFDNKKKNPIVLDIGCNDGSLLELFKLKIECVTVGVDPTDAILESSGKIDHPYREYFDIAIAEKIIESIGTPDIITFTNVFAHIEDLQSLLSALRLLIGPSTLVVIENHYLGSIISNDQFDTFYHEHPRTYSFKSFQVIASQLGLNLQSVEFPSRYGGNIRVTMSKEIIIPELNFLEIDEQKFITQFEDLQRKYLSWLEQGRDALSSLKSSGIFAGKALPGRAVMLISALGISSADMPYIFEQPKSPKIGFYVPGTTIQILSDNDLIESGIERLVLWSWHISDEVLDYLRLLGFKGDVWTPLPKFGLNSKL